MDRGYLSFESETEFSVAVLKKYVATQDPEVLNAMYGHYRDKLDTKPTPLGRVAKSMFYLLSRTNQDIPSGNPEGFADPRFVNQLESSGYFDEMNRHYGK